MLALERRLGLELFHRLPRGYDLTDQGRDLLTKVAAIEHHITPLTVSESRRRPFVKVSAGQWVTDYLCRRVSDLVGDTPILLRFIAADHVLNIGHREAVIGVRNRRPDQIGLAGRRIGRVRFAVYAVETHVTTWARVIGATPSARWLGERIGDSPSIEVTNSRNALDLALAGAARAVLPTFVGDAQSGVQRVSAPIEPLDHEQWLVTHEEDRTLTEVRHMIERIHAVLRAAIA